jgi:hypothetical protein
MLVPALYALQLALPSTGRLPSTVSPTEVPHSREVVPAGPVLKTRCGAPVMANHVSILRSAWHFASDERILMTVVAGWPTFAAPRF